MTEQYQQESINLMPNAPAFQGQLGRADVLISGAAVTPLPLQTVTLTASLISHTAGSSIVEFLEDGVFEAAWEVSIGVATLDRKSSQTSLFLDTGAGFSLISGTSGFGYHRNLVNGFDTTAGVFRSQRIAAGTRIEVASQRIAGTGNLQFIASSCSLLVSFAPV